MLEYLIAKKRLQRAQKSCYNANKKAGLLYFNDKCKGHYEKINGHKFPTKQCSVCPYFRGLNNGRNIQKFYGTYEDRKR